MNAPSPFPTVETRTPYRFTFDEVLKMVYGGVLDDNRVELIEGELIQVSPESLPHMRVKRWLTAYFVRALTGFEVQPDSSLKLTRFTAPEPDLYIFPSSISDETMTGADLSLVIEVAVSSRLSDLRHKQPSMRATPFRNTGSWTWTTAGSGSTANRRGGLRFGDGV